MEIAQLIVELIGKIIWPIFILTIILIFRKHIIKLIPYIKTVKVAGVEMTIEQIEGIVDEVLDNKYKQPDTSENLQKIIYQEDKNIINVESDEGNSTMLVFTANQSFEENLRFNIYYDPATRNHNSPFKYIGLYKHGEVFAVGKLIKIVYCNYEEGKLIATNEDDLEKLTLDEYNRIKETIEQTDYYELQEDCKFFIVDKFFPTKYFTDHTIRAKKYIWLNEIEGFKEGMKAERLAELLNG